MPAAIARSRSSRRRGSCVNAAAPAPVVHRIAISHRLATVLFGALHKAVPERMPAAYYAVSYVVTFQTIDPKLGRKVLVEIEIGGCGGAVLLRRRLGAFLRHAQQRQHPDRDDRERHAAHVPGLWAVAGFGRRRAGIAAASGCGASGASIARRRSSRPTSTASSFRPFGLDGGVPARLSALYLIRDGVRAGAAFEGHQHDGAARATSCAWRPPAAAASATRRRASAALIERDIRHGYVSGQAAAAVYGHAVKAAG